MRAQQVYRYPITTENDKSIIGEGQAQEGYRKSGITHHRRQNQINLNLFTLRPMLPPEGVREDK